MYLAYSVKSVHPVRSAALMRFVMRDFQPRMLPTHCPLDSFEVCSPSPSYSITVNAVSLSCRRVDNAEAIGQPTHPSNYRLPSERDLYPKPKMNGIGLLNHSRWWISEFSVWRLSLPHKKHRSIRSIGATEGQVGTFTRCHPWPHDQKL